MEFFPQAGLCGNVFPMNGPKLFFGALLVFSVYVLLLSAKDSGTRTPEPATEASRQQRKADSVLREKLISVKRYARQNGYNTSVALLADLHRESGCNRLFVFDLRRDSVLFNGLVAHGRCNQRWLEGRRYGNEPGCGCSSLGRYRIGARYQGRFGQSYKLYGLDESNSNALRRFVVLHAHECVADGEVWPDVICQSDGCPTVSPQMIVRIGRIIDTARRPVLLWIFDEQ